MGAGFFTNTANTKAVNTPVARELAPAGLRSSPKSPHAVSQTNSGSRFQDCCAVQREQAPSPRGLVYGGIDGGLFGFVSVGQTYSLATRPLWRGDLSPHHRVLPGFKI
ncbi:hypothetical protein SAMN03159424_05575 [Pseudomonas sp. NFACC05-1]|nr:hypothetical protein SAMN03159424_05575 [Pseudomonas sp. NFACC05-1]